MTEKAPLLEAKNIVLRYRDDAPAILENFNLAIGKNETVSILGPSGVGKSSLLRVLSGLQKPNGGHIFVHGKELTRVDPNIAVAFQNPGLLPWLTLEKNVAFGLDFKNREKLEKSERQNRVNKAIHEVGLDYARKLRPSELSGGMAQRAGLARCFARNPEVLFLDEPFGALDELTRQDMQNLLTKLVKEFSASTLLVTHDIDEALLVSERVILLGGKPANIIDTWTINFPKPRNNFVEELGKIRIEILAALRDAGLKKRDEI